MFLQNSEKSNILRKEERREKNSAHDLVMTVYNKNAAQSENSPTLPNLQT